MDAIDSYRARLLGFAAIAPSLLSKHACTADQAELLRVHLQSLDRKRKFRLAVTGKIKQGKSTLINALIGRELPTVGIDEATATINLIDYGSGDDLDRIRIQWRDAHRADEIHPLAYLEQLKGLQGRQLAQQIKYVHICATAPFLEHVQLIDTPGESGTQLEAIDITSDALIRTLPFVAQEGDQVGLQRFGVATRPFGASAYNSIAVIQKWEEHWPAGTSDGASRDIFATSPFEMAARRAREQQEVLAEAVSTVIPVSGLLSLFASAAHDTALESVLELVHQASPDDLAGMLQMARRFQERDYPSASLALRLHTWDGVRNSMANQPGSTWPLVKMAAWAAHRHGCRNASELRSKLEELSNLRELRTLLDKHFFALSDVIQTGIEIEGALAPCDQAIRALTAEMAACRSLLDEARRIDTVSAREPDTSGSPRLRHFVEQAARRAEADLAWLAMSCSEVESGAGALRGSYALVQREVAALQALDAASEPPIDKVVRHELRRLLGQHGIDLWQRLGCAAEATTSELTDLAWQRHAFWRSGRHGVPRGIHACAVDRLDAILDQLKSG